MRDEERCSQRRKKIYHGVDASSRCDECNNSETRKDKNKDDKGEFQGGRNWIM
jgi:hypothetical protein